MIHIHNILSGILNRAVTVGNSPLPKLRPFKKKAPRQMSLPRIQTGHDTIFCRFPKSYFEIRNHFTVYFSFVLFHHFYDCQVIIIDNAGN